MRRRYKRLCTNITLNGLSLSLRWKWTWQPTKCMYHKTDIFTWSLGRVGEIWQVLLARVGVSKREPVPIFDICYKDVNILWLRAIRDDNKNDYVPNSCSVLVPLRIHIFTRHRWLISRCLHVMWGRKIVLWRSSSWCLQHPKIFNQYVVPRTYQ